MISYLQGREKKLKKKAAATAPSAEPEDPAEEVAEAAETEKVEAHDESLVPVKEKVKKENAVRHRTRPRGPDALTKAILRRKKSTNYWMWAAVAAATLLLVLVALGCCYLL